VSIDVCRGLALALMIGVNFISLTSGNSWLHHAPWHGCTLADVVFPLFLFIIGFSTGLARKPTSKILTRASFIFMWGIAVNFIMYPGFIHLRFLGVLQRIAICYALTAWIRLKTSVRTQCILTVSLLLGYWVMLRFIPVPHHGTYVLTPDSNLAGFVDRIFLSGHMYPKTHDAEGILSTLPAFASTLTGLLSYQLFQYFEHPKKRLITLVCLGFALLVLGGLWGLSFPINKNIWSSSYALWTSGISLLIYSLCYFLVDIQRIRLGWRILACMGRHALMLYILHIVLIKAFLVFR
jgi:predicted acyltransferase